MLCTKWHIFAFATYSNTEETILLFLPLQSSIDLEDDVAVDEPVGHVLHSNCPT